MIYCGFFNAEIDPTTDGYDRTYNASNFTDYYSQFVGSGVCIAQSTDSMRVTLSGTNAVVKPGYLFLRGYWLKSDADYTIPLTAGTWAILAKLNMTAREIYLIDEEIADGYADALCLAYVTINADGSGSVTDMRYDDSVCGVIDSVGNISNKIAYIIDYIDNTLTPEMAGMEDQITTAISTMGTAFNTALASQKSNAEQQIASVQSSANTDIEAVRSSASADIASVRSSASTDISTLSSTVTSKISELNSAISTNVTALNSKVAEVEAAADRIEAVEIGTIRYAASSPGDKWLPCDGRYVSEASYPDLVSVLGKSSIGANNWSMLSSGQIGRDISNGYIYGGRMWVYSFTAKRLYGVSLSGAALKTISVSSSSAGFSALVSPSIWPICLTIVDGGELFLTQIRGSGRASDNNVTLLTATGFSESLSSVALSNVLSSYVLSGSNSAATVFGDVNNCLPYVQKATINGVIKYGMGVGRAYYSQHLWQWGADGSALTTTSVNCGTNDGHGRSYQAGCFNKKNGGELVCFNGRDYIESLLAQTYRVVVPSATYMNLSTAGVETAIVDSANHVYYFGGAYARTIGSVRFNTDGSVRVGPTSIPAGISYPEKTTLFLDSAVYCAAKGLWFFFMGTGLLFTTDLTDASKYGFINTTGLFGALTQYGYMDYDESTSKLVIIGQNESNQVVAAALDLSNWTYSDTGIYLPSLTNGTIQGHIKALEG